MKLPIRPACGRAESDAGILIVEDHGIVALDLSEMLTDWGYSVVGIAHNAEEAFLVLKHLTADLVLMDTDFPGNDPGLAARIHQDIGVPIVYVTGCNNADIGSALAMTNLDGFVPKPIDPNYLAAVIRRALAASKGTRPEIG